LAAGGFVAPLEVDADESEEAVEDGEAVANS
jgi:recombination protein RecA